MNDAIRCCGFVKALSPVVGALSFGTMLVRLVGQLLFYKHIIVSRFNGVTSRRFVLVAHQRQKCPKQIQIHSQVMNERVYVSRSLYVVRFILDLRNSYMDS